MPGLRPVHGDGEEGSGDFRWGPGWWVNRKMDVVMRMLRGEPLDSLCRELGVEAHFLAGGREALKTRASAGSSEESRRLPEAERKIGQLTIEKGILRAAARKRGLGMPPPKRPR